MVEEILSRLAVKSLCGFRCASNSLLALITSPQFIKLHLNRSQKKQRLMALSESYCYSADLETSLPTIFSHPLFKIEEMLEFVGSCNGLICFQLSFSVHPDGKDKFIISNPSTREWRTIPEFEAIGSYEFYGFGYAESIDDYKFVRIICDPRVVHIFSLRNNIWTIVQDDAPNPYPHPYYDYPWPFPYCDPGAVPFHWAFQRLDENKFIVCAFDLLLNKFKVLPTPNSLLISHYRDISVGVLGDCFSLICMLRESTTYETQFWVMKRYGVKESWIKISTIHSETTTFTMGSIQYTTWKRALFKYSPLCFWWKNNENNRLMILFHDFKQLVLYDAKAEAYKDLLFISDHSTYAGIKYTQLYVESLVSPNFNS